MKTTLAFVYLLALTLSAHAAAPVSQTPKTDAAREALRNWLGGDFTAFREAAKKLSGATADREATEARRGFYEAVVSVNYRAKLIKLPQQSFREICEYIRAEFKNLDRSKIPAADLRGLLSLDSVLADMIGINIRMFATKFDDHTNPPVRQWPEVARRLLAELGATAPIIGRTQEIRDHIKKDIAAKGMNREEAQAAWGNPDKVNKEILSGVAKEQWVYPSNMLYFVDGEVESTSSSRTP